MRRRTRDESDRPLLPPRLRDWTKGVDQIGVFWRTAEGGTIQMVNDKAKYSETLLVKCLIHGASKLPESTLAMLKSDLDAIVLRQRKENSG